jgi:hypothetical protein
VHQGERHRDGGRAGERELLVHRTGRAHDDGRPHEVGSFADQAQGELPAVGEPDEERVAPGEVEPLGQRGHQGVQESHVVDTGAVGGVSATDPAVVPAAAVARGGDHDRAPVGEGVEGASGDAVEDRRGLGRPVQHHHERGVGGHRGRDLELVAATAAVDEEVVRGHGLSLDPESIPDAAAPRKWKTFR